MMCSDCVGGDSDYSDHDDYGTEDIMPCGNWIEHI